MLDFMETIEVFELKIVQGLSDLYFQTSSFSR